MQSIRTAVTGMAVALLILAARVGTAQAQQADGPTWLGVELGPVPAALAAHLDIADGVVMVRNVYVDSPADKAGLERYDVILSVDGEPVTGGMKAFSRHIRDRRSGDTIALTLYHKGRQMEREVELGTRPDRWDLLERKYQDDPDVAVSKRFGLRGKVLRPGPDGWELEDLGEMPELEGLHNWLEEYGESERDHDGRVDEARRVDKQGRVLQIRRLPDGTFEVKRYNRDEGEANADVETYESAEQLRSGDPEAYHLLHSRGRKMPAPRRYHRSRPPDAFDFRIYPPRLEIPPGELPERDIEEFKKRFFQGPLKKFHRRPGIERPDMERPDPVEPKTRFEIGPDGRVHVHLRDRDRELTMTYKNEEAFARAAPELYNQYEGLRKKLK